MRILHALPSLEPATGGPPIVAASLAAAQAELSHSTRLISYRFPAAQSDVDTSLARIPGIGRVQVDYLPPLTRSERFFARGASAYANKIIGDFDLVHLHGVWDPLVNAIASAASAAHKPYVLTPHGMLDPWAISQKALKKRVALLMGYRRMLNGTAFLHFLNTDERNLAAPLGLTARTEIIPNGVFLQELDPLPPAGGFRATRPEIGDKPFVLFLSRLHYKKGLDYLADAMAIVLRRFPDCRLVVAGPDGGARQTFIDQIQKLGITAAVSIVGPLYGEKKIQAMVDCACFCLPSRQEGFSMAITEALACMAPVVISTNCHFPEVAEVNAGIVSDLSPAPIAAGIESILADPTAARAMGQRGRALVMERFTWPKVARQMIDAYERAVKL